MRGGGGGGLAGLKFFGHFNLMLWLISTVGLGFRFGLGFGFQTYGYIVLYRTYFH